METATKVKDLDGFLGHAALYKLSKPVSWPKYVDEESQKTTEYVIASAVIAFDHGGSETYLFPSDENGEVLSWVEIKGSMRGTLSHEVALSNAGFSLE